MGRGVHSRSTDSSQAPSLWQLVLYFREQEEIIARRSADRRHAIRLLAIPRPVALPGDTEMYVPRVSADYPESGTVSTTLGNPIQSYSLANSTKRSASRSSEICSARYDMS
jgi:hypothetical protein